MKNLVLSRIQVMQPYQPPLDGRSRYAGMLLDFNERTCPPSDRVLQALQKFVDAQKQQVYPEYFDLTSLIANYVAVNAAEVMVTNGTDQAIDVIFRSFLDRGDTVIIPAPSFVMYEQSAQLLGANIVSPLYAGQTLEFPLAEVLAAITPEVKLVVVCNPNSPTGTLVSVKAIERIAQKAKNAIVYVDEAYFEFSGVSAVGLIADYPNIIVSRTFSKAFGLAALRVGYVVGQSAYIKEMMKVRGPYDVNQMAYYAAAAALQDKTGMQEYVDEVMQQAKPFTEEFFKRQGIPYYPSAANFILFRPFDATTVAENLRQNGVLVRPQSKPNIEGTLRVTIGTRQQMEKFTDIYQRITSQKQKYAFLDRDGTLIFEPQDSYQIDRLDKLRILDGVITGLQELVSQDYKLVLVSNQDGLGTSAFPTKAFVTPQQAMLKTFARAGITFEQIFICPHFEQDNCNCRKPKTGLLDAFLRTTDIDPKQSFVCGNSPSDKGLAKALGLSFVPMVTNGNFANAIKPIIRRTS